MPLKLCLLIVSILIISTPRAAEIGGYLSTGGGYDSNPTGYHEANAQGYGWSEAGLNWDKAAGQGLVSLSYTGSAYSFVPQSTWSAHTHVIGFDYFRTLSKYAGLEAGADLTGSWNHRVYRAYNFREATGYIASTATWSDVYFDAAYRYEIRRYGESPEFDYAQHEANIAARRTFPSKTTLSAETSYARRAYEHQTIEDVYDGIQEAVSRRLRVDTYVSQSLTKTMGLRISGFAQDGSGRSRWRNDYWEVIDDPLASSGYGVATQLSWLVPGGLTLRSRLGGERMRISYIGSDASYASRRDTQVNTGTSVEGLLPWILFDGIVSWNLGYSYSWRESDDSNYTFNRSALVLGVKYMW